MPIANVNPQPDIEDTELPDPSDVNAADTNGNDDDDKSPPGALGPQTPAPAAPGYAGRYGSTLKLFDQAIADKNRAMQAALGAHQAAAQVQTLAQQTAALSAQRHRVAAANSATGITPTSGLAAAAPPQPTLARAQQPALAAPQSMDEDEEGDSDSPEDTNQGALPGNEKPVTLKDYLAKHPDENFTQVNADVKKQHGKSLDEMYDDLVDQGRVEKPDEPLTARQKSELFLEFGLNMMSAPLGNLNAGLAAGGKAALASYKQMKAGNTDDQDREDKIRMQQLKDRGESDRAAQNQEAEDARAREREAGEDRRNAASIAAREEEERDRAKNEKQPTKKIQELDDGRLIYDDGTPVPDKSKPILDAKGKPTGQFEQAKGNKVNENDRAKDKSDKTDQATTKAVLEQVAKLKKADELDPDHMQDTDDQRLARAKAIVAAAGGKSSPASDPNNPYAQFAR